MQKIFLFMTIILISFCSGCESLDAVNPVVQTGKMQSCAKQITDEVKAINDYALEAQRKELEQLRINEE